jgi:hypothetical protein
MHSPWGRDHRVYRKTITFLGQDEEIDWCDACGMEVYPALMPVITREQLRALVESDDFVAMADRYAELNGVRPDTLIDGQGEHHRLD